MPFMKSWEPKPSLKNSEKGLIEVAPLAYMRGRTLDNAFIILDEAQNTTPAQMKMFLTRIGFGTKVVVTGDRTQKDLPKGAASGLDVAVSVLHKIDEIGFSELTSKGCRKTSACQRKIVQAYEVYEARSLQNMHRVFGICRAKMTITIENEYEQMIFKTSSLLTIKRLPKMSYVCP